MNRMRIYIAGPYTNGDIAQNVRNAIMEGDYVETVLGHHVIIPHLTHFWHMLMPHNIEYWYEHDLRDLRTCDALLRLPGTSTGADREVEMAKKLGLTIYHNSWEIPPADPGRT